MTLSDFRARIIGGAVLLALLAVPLASTTAWMVSDRRPEPPRSGVPAVWVEGCLEDPEGWASVEFAQRTIRTFDEQGRSGSPDLPPLSWDGDFARMAVGDEWRVGEHWPHMRFLHRVAEEGSCSFVEVHRHIRRPKSDGYLTGLIFAGSVVVLVVGFMMYRGTVVPLLRRIERIRDAAMNVGSPAYRSVQDRSGDSLADIADVLQRSHGRIEQDRLELERRHQALERHMSELAHDLRTPVSSLVLALQEARAEQDGGVLRRALGDAAYLSSLIENLHQAVRLRHGLDPSEGRTDLGQVVQRCQVRFAALGEASGLQVVAAWPDRPVVVACDPTLAERVIGNLLENALRHATGHVAVVLDLGPSGFVLTVRDDGDGVPEIQLADLAERTFYDDAARPRAEGLGLAITNEVARLAGWTVRYGLGDEGGLEVELAGEVLRA